MAEKNDREISELLDKLREKTVAEAPVGEKPSKKQDKKQKMTDDDVRNLLRKYYDDVDPPASGATAKDEPAEKGSAEHIFGIDTSDFVTEDEPEEVEEPDEIEEVEEVEEIDEPEEVEESEEIEEPEEIEEIEEIEEVEEVEEIDEPEEPEDLEGLEELEELDSFEDVEVIEEPEEPEEIEETEEIEEIEAAHEPAASDTVYVYGDGNDGEDHGEAPDMIIYNYKHVESPRVEVAPTPKPVAEPIVEPELTVEEPAVEESAVEEPAVDEPVSDEPAVEEPVDTVGAHCVRPPEEAPAAETVEEPVFAEEYCPPTVEITEEEPEIPADILDDEGSAELVEDTDLEESEPENPVSDISYENVKESDVDVMVALGFGDKIRDKFGDERIMRATKNLRKNTEIDEKERAFGYVGEEFTEKDQVASIRAAFVRDRRNLLIRLTVTAVFALALLLLENAALFGITLGGIFDPYKYPTAHAMLSLQLLVLCALPSWRSLYDGVVSAISGKATARSVLSFTLGIVALYDILIAIIAPSDGICLYNFPMALGLLLCVGAEYLDLRRENATFEILAQSDELYALTDAGDTPDGRIMISAERTRFVNGYFARTGRHEISSNALILTLVPIAAVGIIVAVVCAALGQGISRSLGGFAGVVAFGAPLSQIIGAAWAELNMSVTLSGRGAAVIGNSIDDEYSKAGILALDDSYAFPTGCAKIVGMQIYNNSEIYDTLYNLNALFSVAGGPLRELFYDSAKELGDPESAELGEYGTDFVSAKIDGVRQVCAGSREALTLRGIALPDDFTGDEDYTVMYFAVNGRACARVDCVYSFGSDFEDTVELLSREGISLRVRSLDPNINESLTEKLGARGRVEVSKEEHHEVADELDAGIVSKVGVRGLMRPLVLRRRTRGVMRAWAIAGYLGMAACTAFGTLLTVGGAVFGLSALAALCRLLCFLPIVGLVFYANRGNKKF